MNGMMKAIRSSILVRQMIRRLLLAVTIAFVVTALLSYLLLWPRLLNQSIQTALDLNTEIAAQIDSNITGMTDTAKYIIHSGDVGEALDHYFTTPNEQNFHRVRLALSHAQSSISNIRGAIIESEGIRFDSIINMTEEDLQWLETDWYQHIRDTEYLKDYTPIYKTELATDQHSMAYASNYYSGTNNYTLTVFFKAYDLVQTVDTLSAGTFNSYLITDYTGSEFLSFYDTMPDGPSELFLSVSDTYFKTSDGYYFVSPVESTGWLSIGFINHSTIISTYLATFLSAIILCVLLCVLALCILIPVIYRMTYPIKSLTDSFTVAASGDLTVRSKIESDNEIGELSNMFNDMVSNLSTHIENQIVYESNQQKLQYNLLIAQIDPHFIYNTMSIINVLARQNRTDDIVMINSALIKIMQNYLRIRALDVSDSVAQEIDMVQQYWIIQNMRYDNHVNLNIDVPQELLDASIPKNLIQPLVENALFHGLIDEDTGEMNGNIWIRIRREGNNLLIQIEDDGHGIDPERLQKLKAPLQPETTEMLQPRGRHIGLSNIRRRLSYLFNNTNCVQVESTINQGTIITLFLPFTT